jgi:phospholipid transport system substrate-binding protein
MRYRWVLSLLGLAVAILGHAQAAAAGEATDHLKAEIDALYRSVGPGDAQPTAATRAIVDRMFDWPAMAEASLGRHWRSRTPAERTQFTQLFADLFARAYVSRIHLVDARSFEYLGDTVTGDRSTVRTKVFTRRGSGLNVEYVVRATPGRRWLVQDVRVETISLVDNYRVQFDAVVARSSYADLVARLRAATK